MVSSEKALVTITYAPYSNQLIDVNPVGWFARYVAIHVREINYVKINTISKTVIVNLLLLMPTSKSKYESLHSFLWSILVLVAACKYC